MIEAGKASKNPQEVFMRRTLLLVTLMTLVLTGCLSPAATATATPLPTQPATDTPKTLPAATHDLPTQSPTPIPAATPIPNPMSIEALRQRDYPASPIVTVEELAPGSNYSRYYVYYLSDGLKIYALLTVPEGEMPEGGWPGIVFNHGYIPPEIYRTTERYIAYVDEIAKAGYVVFRIDYRGNDRSEGEAHGAYGDPGYTIDVLNAVSALKNDERVNPDKIGMWGHSMGGFLTLRAMVISPDIKAGVIWSGVVAPYYDILYNWHRTGPFTPSPSSRGAGWRTGWLEQYGTPEENPTFWNSISANSYLDDISGPLQLHHGTADEDVPLAFSRNLAAQLADAHKTVEFYTYKDDNHNLSNYFGQAMGRTIDFFDRYLK
jgi:dipeptidyl aminopeptidase/acylaminoacyl peptidase